MKNSAPAQALSVDQQIRVVLVDFDLLYEKHDPEGISASEMARAIGVSRQQMARILAGTRKLQLHHVPRLPQRAYAAVMNIFRRARGERIADQPRSIESRTLRISRLEGEHSGIVERITEDGTVDRHERAKARTSYIRIADECDAGIRDLDVIDAEELSKESA